MSVPPIPANDLVERLRRPDVIGAAPVNPDGPEAAALIEEMVEALQLIATSAERDASDRERQIKLQAIAAKARAVLTKVTA